MILINKLIKPGGIKRLELHPDTVKIVFSAGTERIYNANVNSHNELSGYGCLDAMSGVRGDSQ